jgi:hypothetical protein
MVKIYNQTYPRKITGEHIMIPNSKEKQLEAVCALESCEHEKK